MAYNRQSKLINADRITWCIWQNGSISRVDVARKLGLDKSTVTMITAELLDAGILVELEEGEASPAGGRRPIYLGINPQYGAFVGIKFQVGSFTAVAVDPTGRVLDQRRYDLEHGPGRLGPNLRLACEQASSLVGPGRRLLGVGVGISALVDPGRCRILSSNPFDVRTPLDLLPEALGGLPYRVYVDNDANCCAYGELAFHKTTVARDLLFALVEFRPDLVSAQAAGGLGIGLGLVLDGKVRHGTGFTAGEFRSVFWKEGDKAQLSLPPERIRHMLRDPAVLTEVARELAANLALLTNTFNLDEVVFGGEIEGAGVDFPALFRQALVKNWIYPTPPSVTIRYSSLGPLAVAYGAAGMALERSMMANRFLDLRGTGVWNQDSMALAVDGERR